MRKKYYGIRKLEWDALWHALYTAKDGYETWDRVSLKEAQAIARNLFAAATIKVVSLRTGKAIKA